MGQLTEGPWKQKGRRVFTEDDDWLVCEVYGAVPEETAQEIAAHIAQAPLLLKRVDSLVQANLRLQRERDEARRENVPPRPSPIEDTLRRHIAVLTEEVGKRNEMVERLLETNRRSLEALEREIREKAGKSETSHRTNQLLERILENMWGPPQK